MRLQTTGKSFPGKNASIVIGSKYPAVSSAETKSTTGISQEKTGRALSKAEVAMSHFEVKPPVGGIPIRAIDANVKDHIVIGICLPIPFNSSTLVFPVLKMIAPAVKNRHVLTAAWTTV